jgi:hypothetical protein
MIAHAVTHSHRLISHVEIEERNCENAMTGISAFPERLPLFLGNYRVAVFARFFRHTGLRPCALQ